MNQKPKVAIVIVNWNKKKDVLNLLSSLKSLEYGNYDIIVVDNASTDDSVQAISDQYPEAELVVNSENLGGTGGFNTGLKHASESGRYKYIWLLDNDAEVKKDTLRELVDALEADERAGMAGSRIMDPENRDVTVEAGAYFKWNTVGVLPLFRNTRNTDTDRNVYEVDYVAVCSALIRVEALDKVGLMDERYFLFWDDMDWGLEFRKYGYRVLSVMNSVVYHPAFTEKRGVLVDYYYGNRNSLLAYTKHTRAGRRILIFYSYLRLKCSQLFLVGLNGRISDMKLGFKGIYDFIIGKWGGIRSAPNQTEMDESASELPGIARKILILNDGNRDEIHEALGILRNFYPEAIYTLLIPEDRSEYFEEGFDNMVTLDTSGSYSLFKVLSIFVRIAVSGYDLAVSFKDSSPFSYAADRGYSFIATEKIFRQNGYCLKNIWKLIFSTAAGEIASIILLPVLFISSLRYR